MSIQMILSILSGVAFIVYGILCVSTDHMRSEFKRYNLEPFRILTGILEICGGIGSLFPKSYGPIYPLACAGLFTLMLMGILVRIKLKDSVIKILPAFMLMIINFYLTFMYFR